MLKKQIKQSWEFQIITKNKIYNINEQIINFIDSEKILSLDKNYNYEKIIKGKKIDKKSFLRISNNSNKNWKPITIKLFTPFKLYLGDIEKNFPFINIVYFFNAELNNCYEKLMKDQLKDLIKCNILDNQKVKLHPIIICSDLCKKTKINNLFRCLEKYGFYNYQIIYSENKYKEYEGINKVWEISRTHNSKESLIFYFHGKGMSYYNNKYFYIRQPIERFIFKNLFYRWKKNIELLIRFKSVNKLGMLSGGNGWLWFNFWIVKSSYIKNLEKPLERNRACYYEEWLGRFEIENCSDKVKKYKNEFNDIYHNTLNETLSILSKPRKLKFNIGTFCEVGKGGFVGLGIEKLKYRIWYYFYFMLSKISYIKNAEDRFIFF